MHNISIPKNLSFSRDEGWKIEFKRRNKSTSFPQDKSLSALIWSYKVFKFFFMANIIAQEQKDT